MFKKHKFISFLIIFARMGTSTNYIELKRGLSLYIKQYYKPTTVTANTYSWGDRIRTIIGKNYPCILGLTSHPRYGEHWVVVTGYNFTSHNSGTYTVNDGWENVGININSSYTDGGLILGNKSVVKRKSYITMLVFISTIIILFLIVNMNENSSKIKVKGGEGYGMFDKATRIEIIFNDNEYIVSNPDEIEQIIRLCRQNWEPSNTHITKEDCDMCVKFIGTDTEVWVDTETLSSYIGESFVQMPEDLFKKIKEVVSLSNTPRPGKFVYKLMFLKFSRLIF